MLLEIAVADPVPFKVELEDVFMANRHEVLHAMWSFHIYKENYGWVLHKMAEGDDGLKPCWDGIVRMWLK